MNALQGGLGGCLVHPVCDGIVDDVKCLHCQSRLQQALRIGQAELLLGGMGR